MLKVSLFNPPLGIEGGHWTHIEAVVEDLNPKGDKEYVRFAITSRIDEHSRRITAAGALTTQRMDEYLANQLLSGGAIQLRWGDRISTGPDSPPILDQTKEWSKLD